MIAQKLIDKLDGKVNPIVVKELRQAVQGRFVVGILMLFLLVSVGVIAMVAINANEDNINFRAGREIFLVLYGILLAASMILVPLYAMMRLSLERVSDNVDLLFATTLKAGAIVRGKLFSTIILGSLMFASCMPFLTITYMLRGIDLPTIFFLIVMAFLAMVVCIQASIFVGCLPLPKGAKSIIGLALLFGQVSLVVGMCVIADEEILRNGIAGMFSGYYALAGFLSFLGIVFATLGLLYVLSVSMLSAPTSNRALPIRLYVTGIWIVMAIVCGFWAHDQGEVEYFTYIMTSVMVPLLWLMLFGAISERSRSGPRVLKKVPTGFFRRRLAFLLYSGASGGIIWTLLMLIITFVAVFKIDKILNLSLTRMYDTQFYYDFLTGFLCITLYLICYSLIAMGLRLTLLSKFFKQVHTWVLAISLMIFSAVLQIVLVICTDVEIDFKAPNDQYWLLLNPVGILIRPKDSSLFITFSLVWALICLLIFLIWGSKRFKEFKKLQPNKPVQLATEAA